MRQTIRHVLTVGLFLLSMTSVSRAQTTYDDPRGRFAIDLPKGWQLAPQTDDKVFVFQGEGKSIIIEYVPAVNDPAELLKRAEATVKSAAMPNPVLDGEVKDMAVNGLPARWCVYKSAEKKALLAALCGSVALSESGLYSLSIIPAGDLGKWRDKLERTFQTIRASSHRAEGAAGDQAGGPGALATFEDPQGRFAIDLPKGWQPQPQTDDKVFVFQGEGKSIIIEYVPEVNDPAELFKKTESTIRLSGMTQPALDGEVMDMTMNGLPARWGVFKGLVSGTKLAALCGGVANGENGFSFFSFVSEADLGAWKGRLEKSFQTIRASGGTVTGVEGARAVAGGPAPAGAPQPWSSDLVSLTLPPGWTEQALPRGIEKEVKGMFMYGPVPGISLIVVCYKGLGMNRAKVLEAGMKTVTIPNPGLKPVEAEEMDLPVGKVSYLSYKGLRAAAGTELEMAAVLISCKADKSYANLVLFGPGQVLPELKSQALEIAKTVK